MLANCPHSMLANRGKGGISTLFASKNDPLAHSAIVQLPVHYGTVGVAQL